MSERIIHATVANFDELVKDGLCLVDFWASWCGPCKMLAPVIDQYVAEYGDITVLKIDVDTEDALAKRFGIMSIPTLILFKDGKEVAKDVGYKNLQQLKMFVDNNK